MSETREKTTATADGINGDLLSLAEAITLLGISKPTMYRLLEREAIKGFKVGNQWRFRTVDLTAYLQRGPVSVALSTVPLEALDEEIAIFNVALQKVEATEDEYRFIGAASEDAESALEPAEVKVDTLMRMIIVLATHSHASDIHLEPMKSGFSVRLRIDGVLREVRQMPTAVHAPLIAHLKAQMGLNQEERRVPQDGRMHFTIGEMRAYDMRINMVPTIYGENAVMRILDQHSVLIGLDRLGLTPESMEQLLRLIQRPTGLVIVTGPTGSGKTTTLYSCLNRINKPELKMLTTEDPVEYAITGITQVAVNRSAGLTFPVALRAFLRQDPDVIMAGEIRDRETAEILIQAALTGHLVFSTLHAQDAPSTLTRLADIGIEQFLIVSALNGAISQRLVRLLCPHCKQPAADIVPAAFEHVQQLAVRGGYNLPADAVFSRAVGCEHCNFTGYRGRTALFEVMEFTPAVKEAFLAKAPPKELVAAAVKDGMRTLVADGIRKAADGLTTVEEVLRVTAQAQFGW